MRKLFLPDDVLMQVEKPARYTGGELNMVQKEPSEVAVRFCMCFPDVYEIGMSHLGIQILYSMFNSWEDTYCERVYCPWPDLDAIMRERDIPLFSMETQTPIHEFDFLGITLQYEMCYTNILQVLDLAGIPLMSKDRTGEDPIVMAGGPCTYNPEPVADFMDMFYIGEGEVSFRELLDLYKKCRAENKSRETFLYLASFVPGIYVPSLYAVSYNDDGTIKEFKPHLDDRTAGILIKELSGTKKELEDRIPRKIVKQVETDLDHTYYPEKPLVPHIRATQDRIVLEIQRGCIRGCRFCQAGMIYRPIRPRSLEYLKKLAITMLECTGYEEMTLSSLSSSDYEELAALVTFLLEQSEKYHCNIALPSLRIDAFSLDVMSKVQDVKKSSLTFAPEAGSQRMRDVINKNLTEEEILKGATEAFHGGWNKVKLYFMLGLPGERDEDIEGIATLSNTIAATYFDEIPKEQRHGRPEITASTSFFVPKPFTPFQWSGMGTASYFEEKRRFLKDRFKEQLNHKSLRYICHDALTSELEGIFARGDRRLSGAILKAYRRGCIFDAWTEFFKPDVWNEVLDECGVDRDFYNYRERGEDEIFPWDFIDIGVSKAFLRKEYERAKEGVTTPNCREQCSGCGAARYGCGVCVSARDKK